MAQDTLDFKKAQSMHNLRIDGKQQKRERNYFKTQVAFEITNKTLLILKFKKSLELDKVYTFIVHCVHILHKKYNCLEGSCRQEIYFFFFL